MRRDLLHFICAIGLFSLAGTVSAQSVQDVIVPAGTLIQCTLDEPNFSSATAEVGDPVICHLRSLREFGHSVFPRGSYLAGHLEADKEPGHFAGKGYMKLQFDRIGLPNTDVPVPAKVIAARGLRVDRHGDIVGKGHPKRDAAEWMIPPLWPWKVVSLPARGPRPQLKGEESLTLRLMDDITLPVATGPTALEPGWHYFGEPTSQLPRPARHSGVALGLQENRVEENKGGARKDSTPLPELTSNAQPLARLTTLCLRSNATYEVATYRIDGNQVNYVLPGGTEGAVDVSEVDWKETSRLNAEPGNVLTPRTLESEADAHLQAASFH